MLRYLLLLVVVVTSCKTAKKDIPSNAIPKKSIGKYVAENGEASGDQYLVVIEFDRSGKKQKETETNCLSYGCVKKEKVFNEEGEIVKESQYFEEELEYQLSAEYDEKGKRVQEEIIQKNDGGFDTLIVNYNHQRHEPSNEFITNIVINEDTVGKTEIQKVDSIETIKRFEKREDELVLRGELKIVYNDRGWPIFHHEKLPLDQTEIEQVFEYNDNGDVVRSVQQANGELVLKGEKFYEGKLLKKTIMSNKMRVGWITTTIEYEYEFWE
jgi:hypothetical protein